MKKTPRILVAGVGNELRQDDAFGIEVVRQLMAQNALPAYAKVMEVGIAGISLVQELYDGYEVLVLVDAVSWEGAPAQIYLREAEVADITELSFDKKRAFLADMHYTNPMRALMLARALGILPRRVYILGCEVVAYDDFAMGLSREVEAAIPLAISRLKSWIDQIQTQHPAPKQEKGN